MSNLVVPMMLVLGLAEKNTQPLSAIDQMIRDASLQPGEAAVAPAPGSIFSSSSVMSDLTRDLRATRIHDIVTILVSDRASAISRGTSATQRKSSATGGISTVLGRTIPQASGALTMSSDQSLQAQGSTGRESSLSTAVTARVTHVLPNGLLVVEATKEVLVNSEKQLVHVRGVVRPIDISTANTVASDRVANLEIRVNGKGLVNDSIRRPNLLYRILLGVLPF
ncbi:hypothetical protein F183_A43400 [Bryobacterales bacterium F-183]|nr:hypothetical protein F183_A43400 [Bryobacterales bacterium F-183]